MKIILADTETAGLRRPVKPATGIVQVAWLYIAEQEGKYVIVEENCHITDPGMPIDAKASEVHGLYDIDVQGKPSVFDVFKLEEPSFFIAHNAAFDFPRLAEGIENCVGKLCTLLGARKYLKDAPNHKLTTLVEFYGLEAYPAHDALGDTKMTLGVLNLLLEKTGMSLFDLAKDVMNAKVPEEMTFGKYKGLPFREVPSDYIRYMLGREDLDEGIRTAFEMQRRLRGNLE